MNKWYQKAMVFVLLLLFILGLVQPTNIAGTVEKTPNIASMKGVESELSLNLTQQGNLDWRQIATEPTVGAENDSKKNLPKSLISFKEEIAHGSETQTRQTNALFSSSFNDGTSGSKKDIKTSRATYGVNSNFSITVPAEKYQVRELNLYFSVWGAQVDFEVWQGQEKVDHVTVDTGAQEAGSKEKAQHMTIKYSGNGTNEPITLKGKLSKAYDARWSNYALSAITLHQNISLTSIQIPKETIITLKKNSQFSYTTTPINASVDQLEYIIGDTSIVSFEDGQLIGNKSGETTIQIKSGNIISNVGKILVSDLTLFPQNQSLTVPMSGTSRRRFTVFDSQKTKYSDVNWSVNPVKDYLKIDEDGLLTITPSTEFKPGTNLAVVVTATDKRSECKVSVPVKVRFTKNLETPANPISKLGWELYYQDEFNNKELDRLSWSDYYLRNWATEGDKSAKANYSFEDGAIVLKIDEGAKPWSPLDGKVISSGIQSFEKTGLHKFGSNKYDQSRVIPTFDGSATTKYGYFEIRAKLPDETDGSHNAWWMIGNQEDMNIYESGADYVTNQMMEVDINESPFKNIQNNTIVSTYHPYETDSISDATASYDRIDPEIADIDNEFHTYGLEWNENELIFYFDNQEFRRIKVKIDHRLATLLGIYANSWGGDDKGIYPKEFTVDYFRIYKRLETKGFVNDIFFDENTIPQKVAVPIDDATHSFQIKATPVDTFHKNIANAELEWYFAKDTPFKEPTKVTGATIDSKTGKVTIDKTIHAGTVLRVSARSVTNPRIRQSYRIFVENQAEAKPTVILFEDKQKINNFSIGSEEQQYDIKAAVYDQYLQKMETLVDFKLVKDTPGLTPAQLTGVSLSSEGKLIVSPEAIEGEIFYVQASANGLTNNYTVQLTK